MKANAGIDLKVPAGDAALTRRTRRHSLLCAVVLRWSRARKRYERQCSALSTVRLGEVVETLPEMKKGLATSVS